MLFRSSKNKNFLFHITVQRDARVGREALLHVDRSVLPASGVMAASHLPSVAFKVGVGIAIPSTEGTKNLREHT